jgi:hypothetical protein
MHSNNRPYSPKLNDRYATYRNLFRCQAASSSSATTAAFIPEAVSVAQALKICVVVPVNNEAVTLPAVLTELKALPFPAQIICLINGCQDDSFNIATEFDVEIHECSTDLGHDIGRAWGVSDHEAYDIYLFTDADLIVKAADLAVFVYAVAGGVDVALNDFSHWDDAKRLLHPVNLCKAFLNITLGQSELGSSSLTAIPHALSRRALTAIGSSTLACPPLALVKAKLAGLKIAAVHFVDVTAVNPRRYHNRAPGSLTDLIIGDHLEALGYLQTKLGARGWFPDNMRRRDLLTNTEVDQDVNY